MIPAGKLAAWPAAAVRRMTHTRAATLRFLNSVPAKAIHQPRTQGQWSLRDAFAHFVAWEEEAAKRLRLIARGQAGRVRFDDDMQEVHRFNARVVSRARKLSWPALLHRAAQVRVRIIAALNHVPLAELQNRAHRYPVTLWLPEFAWTHEQGHLHAFRAWRRHV